MRLVSLLRDKTPIEWKNLLSIDRSRHWVRRLGGVREVGDNTTGFRELWHVGIPNLEIKIALHAND